MKALQCQSYYRNASQVLFITVVILLHLLNISNAHNTTASVSDSENSKNITITGSLRKIIKTENSLYKNPNNVNNKKKTGIEIENKLLNLTNPIDAFVELVHSTIHNENTTTIEEQILPSNISEPFKDITIPNNSSVSIEDSTSSQSEVSTAKIKSNSTTQNIAESQFRPIIIGNNQKILPSRPASFSYSVSTNPNSQNINSPRTIYDYQKRPRSLEPNANQHASTRTNLNYAPRRPTSLQTVSPQTFPRLNYPPVAPVQKNVRYDSPREVHTARPATYTPIIVQIKPEQDSNHYTSIIQDKPQYLFDANGNKIRLHYFDANVVNNGQNLPQFTVPHVHYDANSNQHTQNDANTPTNEAPEHRDEKLTNESEDNERQNEEETESERETENEEENQEIEDYDDSNNSDNNQRQTNEDEAEETADHNEESENSEENEYEDIEEENDKNENENKTYYHAPSKEYYYEDDSKDANEEYHTSVGKKGQDDEEFEEIDEKVNEEYEDEEKDEAATIPKKSVKENFKKKKENYKSSESYNGDEKKHSNSHRNSTKIRFPKDITDTTGNYYLSATANHPVAASLKTNAIFNKESEPKNIITTTSETNSNKNPKNKASNSKEVRKKSKNILNGSKLKKADKNQISKNTKAKNIPNTENNSSSKENKPKSETDLPKITQKKLRSSSHKTTKYHPVSDSAKVSRTKIKTKVPKKNSAASKQKNPQNETDSPLFSMLTNGYHTEGEDPYLADIGPVESIFNKIHGNSSNREPTEGYYNAAYVTPRAETGYFEHPIDLHATKSTRTKQKFINLNRVKTNKPTETPNKHRDQPNKNKERKKPTRSESPDFEDHHDVIFETTTTENYQTTEPQSKKRVSYYDESASEAKALFKPENEDNTDYSDYQEKDSKDSEKYIGYETRQDEEPKSLYPTRNKYNENYAWANSDNEPKASDNSEEYSIKDTYSPAEEDYSKYYEKDPDFNQDSTTNDPDFNHHHSKISDIYPDKPEEKREKDESRLFDIISAKDDDRDHPLSSQPSSEHLHAIYVPQESQSVSESKHHPHKKENHKHKKGEGSKHHSDYHSKEGKKGDKGYKSYHEEEKHQKGHHDKEDHKKHYEDHGGKEKKHHVDSGHQKEAHKEEKGQKGAKYDEHGKHEKGHSTKGEHVTAKKDEYEKKVEFFDEYHEAGGSEKKGGFHEEKAGHKGGHHKEGHHDSGHGHKEHGKKGHSEHGGHYDEEKGHKNSAGHDTHYKHDSAYGKKSSKSDHKKFGYKKGD